MTCENATLLITFSYYDLENVRSFTQEQNLQILRSFSAKHINQSQQFHFTHVEQEWTTHMFIDHVHCVFAHDKHFFM